MDEKPEGAHESTVELPTNEIEEKQIKQNQRKIDVTSLSIWLLVLLLFGALITGEVIASSKPDKEAKSQRMNHTLASGIRMSLMGNELQRSASDSNSPAKLKNDSRSLLESIPKNDRSVGDELLLIAIQKAFDQPISAEEIKLVIKDKSPIISLIGRLATNDKTLYGNRVKFLQSAKKEGLAVELAAVELTAPPSERSPLSSHFGSGVLVTMGIALTWGMFLAFVGVVSWVTYFVQKRDWKPLGHPVLQIDQRSAAIMAAISIGCMIVFQIFVTAGSLISGSSKLSNPAVAISGLLFIGTLIFWLKNTELEKQNLFNSLFKNSPMSVFHQVLAGFCAAAANLILVIGVMAIYSQFVKIDGASHPLNDEFSKGMSQSALIIILIMATIVAPIWEEIAFRGMLARAFHKVFNSPALGILASSFIFAAIHPQGPALWIALGMVGAMGGILTYQTRSLLPAIVMHFTHNFTLVLLGYAYS